ncbi:hypothetical protein A1Q2_07484 [Trichosporon asahii var. asahii CBS 8904]|uniref:HECT-type E3 ubiquitin transferase n=1 Tax=Trichosporon asahii var. asahii (strain CBS 8904) TaxID=1220162 RepID=K1VBR3_TRIAC|nr:hypothetical protein A1Q2_07484 [Trichosporon asahii var. asahii CBS 8904]
MDRNKNNQPSSSQHQSSLAYHQAPSTSTPTAQTAPVSYHSNTVTSPPSVPNAPVSNESTASANVRITRAQHRQASSSSAATSAEAPPPATPTPVLPRRSARLSSNYNQASPEQQSTPSSKGKADPSSSSTSSLSADRKGKKRATREPTPPRSDPAEDAEPAPKRSKKSPAKRGKGKAKATPKPKMPKKTAGKKGDTSARQLIDDNMDEDEHHWGESTSAFLDDEHYREDEDMDESDHDEDEEDDDDEDEHRGSSAYDRLARLADGAMFDEATAAALFGGEYRAFGGFMSGLSSRFKRLKENLRSSKTSKRLAALRECSDLLLVSNEDTLGASFSTSAFATEFIAILSGKPNIDSQRDGDEQMGESDEMDEDAQLAAALAMSAGDAFPEGDQEDMECQLLACRCLAHLMEALPGSGHTLVHLGAVPVLCSKLNEISYIELAEQTLSISAEYPAAIVREGGLAALLNFLPFFSTNVQRTAVTTAANCCRNISGEHFAMIRDVFPILREVLTQTDQRLVEQATLAVLRTLESYRHNAEHLEGLLDLPTVVAINALLMPAGGSPIISDSTYTHLLKALTSAARASAKVTIALLEAGMTDTVHYILTGVLPAANEQEEQGDAPGGQGLGGGVADMAVMQNLAHRPKDQIEEALGLVCELLPPLPRDGVFDHRAYSEKSLAKLQRRSRPSSSRRSSSRAEGGSGSPGEPAEASSVPVLGSYPPGKSRRDVEALNEQRLTLLKSQPELVSKFMRCLMPVLVDVYAASVSLRVRTKALTGLTKATAFAEPGDLKQTLTNVPMSSFLGSIISSKDNPTFVLHALQLVELLAGKLPDVYLTSFHREGVVFEIESLAEADLSTKVKEEREEAKAKEEAKEGNLEDSPTTPRAGQAQESPTKSNVGELSGVLANLISSQTSASHRIRSSSVVDPNDANILRARVIGAKRIFAVDDTQQNEASLVLEELTKLVERLCHPEATEPELRDTLREIAAQFSNVGQALSSFELLKSGLVDGLLEYVDIDGTVPSSARRDILFEIFSDTAVASPSPLVMLVKRLHESLGRLENLEVETAFNGMGTGSSSLARSMRIRLQAEEGEDIPKQMSALSVTIQAIAPVQALHDYLRPRVADPNYLSGNSALQNMFAAYAASRGGGGGSTSRLLAALAAGSRGVGAPPGTRDEPSSSTQPPQSQQQQSSESKETKEDAKPQRRRSARLSGLPPDAESTAADAATGEAAAGPSSGAAASSEPAVLPQMPVSMDFDDDYSEDEYDAEVFEEDMEEELERPTEKVVNMSMAPDGSRVEAQTPDGTRIATPNQAASSSANAGSSSTPSRSSYAGAVKTAPVDWHLEFSINGQVLSLEDTVYGAVHKYAKSSSSPLSAFNVPVTFKFRKVEGPASAKAPVDAPSPASISSTLPPVLDPAAPVYSEDEYDAEVFEEDMEEELERPTEKVVNMSMAPDGSRVEAQTPDGTRIATPNQAASSSANAGSSSTPSRSSYAGAVKTAPVDWHLEFSINGQVLSLEDTVYGAVHKYAKSSSSPLSAFNVPVTFKFRKVEGPASAKAPVDAPSPASISSTLPPVLDPAAPVSKILRLLRVVHTLCVEGRDTLMRVDVPDESLFVNNKLTAKLARQLEETMILASNCLPEWAVELPKHFSFLFPFETRYSFLRSTSFGYGRLIAHWQASQPRSNSNSRRDDNLAHLGRLVRQKVRISRAQLLESCVKVLELYGTSNGILEVEYFDEIGTGLGPTLEFYSLASKEFSRRSLHMWRDEDTSKEGPYVFAPNGLFPAPTSEKIKNAPSSKHSYFKTLGLFIGRALLDSRIIDVNLNKVFLKLLLGKPVRKNIATLKQVDETLARSLERLQTYLQARQEIESLTALPASSRRNKLSALTIGGAKLQDLSLDFTLPGYDIELKPGGRMIDVDDSNLEEYLELVLDKTLGSGIAEQVKELQVGFSMIFPINDLGIFSPEELALLCGNTDEDWSKETLEQTIKADHGYNADSRSIRNLIEILSAFDSSERREFLQFMTGSPKLPIGGWRSLNPPFTVVRKPHEPPIKADSMLPSVMTCAQYLKLPDYSSKEVLATQLWRAIRDGSGSFHLS